jgi:hypothetical protein
LFQYLASVDEEYQEAAFSLSLKVFAQILLLGGASEEGSSFSINDIYSLYDVDFFNLQSGQGRSISSRASVKELSAVMVTLARRIIGENCDQAEQVRNIYNQYIKTLPDSRSAYRFQLFIFSLCPIEFRLEIKEVLFSIFNHDKLVDFIGGAEYEQLVKSGFSSLTETDRREYVSKVIEVFSKEDGLKSYGRDILSAAMPWLTQEEKNQATDKLGQLIDNYQPSPSIGPVIAGTVRHQSPGDEKAWEQPVAELIKRFKGEWSPKSIRESYKETDFLRPVDAEGVGERIQEEVVKRTAEFINHAELFFDRDFLDPQYTYSYLQGIDKLLREKKFPDNVNITPLFKMFDAIRTSGEAQSFGKQSSRDRREWLANWDDVHSTIADILKAVLSGEKLSFDFFEWRNPLFSIIQYLLHHPRPTPEEEEPETATSTITSPGEEPLVTDPYTNAINSVRGRAFEAFVEFSYNDEKRLKPENKKMGDDVKSLYEETLEREKAPALFFMFGRYLYFFYFKDISWIHSLLHKIFPVEPQKTRLYIAAWEGYLSNGLYEEIFSDSFIQKLYERAIILNHNQYPKRSYFVKLDEGLGSHLALAFAHYDEFTFKHPLFQLFWKTGDDEKHAGFVSFIGRSFLSGKNEHADKQLKESNVTKNKIIEFWEWALKQNLPPKVYEEFGYWMNTEKNVFDLKWLAQRTRETLEKTQGVIEWDYGLMTSIPELAKAAPDDVVEILRLHFLEAGVRNSDTRGFYHVQDEWLEAFKIVYHTPQTQSATHALISKLLEEGGAVYWPLEDVMK